MGKKYFKPIVLSGWIDDDDIIGGNTGIGGGDLEGNSRSILFSNVETPVVEANNDLLSDAVIDLVEDTVAAEEIVEAPEVISPVETLIP